MAVPLKRQAATNGSKGTLATAASKSASKPHASAKKPSGVHLRPAAALEETKSRGSMASGDNDDFDYNCDPISDPRPLCAVPHYWNVYWPSRCIHFRCLQTLLNSSTAGQAIPRYIRSIIFSFMYGPELFVVAFHKTKELYLPNFRIISVHRCLSTAVTAAQKLWSQEKQGLGKYTIKHPPRFLPFAIRAEHKEDDGSRLETSVVVSSHECFARNCAYVIIQRPTYSMNGFACGAYKVCISKVVGGQVDQTIQSVFRNLDCVYVLERNKVLPHILFGAGFAETYQHSPAFGIAGFLTHGDNLTSYAYSAYVVEGYKNTLSVWTETRDEAKVR